MLAIRGLTGTADIVRLERWKSACRYSIAGDSMDEEKGAMKAKADRAQTTINLRLLVKLSGIVGSSWPSQPTMFRSRSDTGRI